MTKLLDFVAIALLIAGGLNWFLIGVFNINVVHIIWGHMPIIARSLYILVGLSAFYTLLHVKKHI